MPPPMPLPLASPGVFQNRTNLGPTKSGLLQRLSAAAGCDTVVKQTLGVRRPPARPPCPSCPPRGVFRVLVGGAHAPIPAAQEQSDRRRAQTIWKVTADVSWFC